MFFLRSHGRSCRSEGYLDVSTGLPVCLAWSVCLLNGWALQLPSFSFVAFFFGLIFSTFFSAFGLVLWALFS